MKHIRMISRYLQMGVMLFFLAACNDEYIADDTTPQETLDGVAQVEIFTNAGKFEKPVTRATAADEDNVKGVMPWVLVFRGDNDNAIFFEASRTLGSNGKLTVPLTKTTNKSRLIIIANPPDKFFDGVTDNQNFDKAVLTSKLSGKTYAQAQVILNTKKLSSPQGTVPYAGGYLPMSGTVSLNTINDQTTIGTPAVKVQLTRIVGKVTVENTAAGFTMEGFTVIGAKQYGRFVQSAPPITVGNKVNYFGLSPADPVAGISNGKDPVYIYESAAGETSLIIKGKYNGVTGYYRLAFKDSNNTLMSVARNKWYQFKIKDVKISGYKTKEEAMVAPPSNIMAELLVIDQNSMEIIDNGHYYIGLTNSEFVLYSGYSYTKVTAVTVTTNAPVGTSSNVEILSVSPAGSMSISSANIVPNGTVSGTDIEINLTDHFASGALKITVGNLVRIVKVKRRSIRSRLETIEIFSPGYVSGRIESQGESGGVTWLTLSTDGIKYVDTSVTRPDNPGTIYLKLLTNPVGTNARRGGVVYLDRKDSEGYLKLYIDQEGNPDV